MMRAPSSWLISLVVGAIACTGRDARDAVAPENLIGKEALAPRLLHDEAEIAQYVAAFPVDDYEVVEVFAQGKFYLDDTDDAIKSILRKGGRWETNIDFLLRNHIRPGTTVIDAGAHIGTHALRMSGFVGARGRIYAFEPQRKIYRELVHNLNLNGVTNVVPLRFALGAEPTVIEMNPATPGNEGGTSVGHGGDRAELRTLDSFGFANVSVLKIDVEGFEDAVIDGARATIARNRPVIIVEIQGGKEYQTASPEVRAKIDGTRKRLTDLGYDVTQVSPHDYLAVPAGTTPK